MKPNFGPFFYENHHAIDETLKRLNTEYIDLMILHQPSGNYIAGYKQLEKSYKAGKFRAIGISNFNLKETQEILDNGEIMPALIQVEAHPYYTQTALRAFLAKEKIAV